MFPGSSYQPLCLRNFIRIWWPIRNLTAVNDRLHMIFVHTEVVWKWQQYGNNFIAVFPVSALPSKMCFDLSANNPVAGCGNQSDIWRDVIWTSAFSNEFFCLGFLSQAFTNRRTAEEGGGQFFNSSLPLPPASHTLRH